MKKTDCFFYIALIVSAAVILSLNIAGSAEADEPDLDEIILEEPAASEPIASELAVSSENTASGNALDELMRSLNDVRAFDGALYGLEGNFEVIGEVSGVLEEGQSASRVRLVAIRREGGVFDRGLILEVIPQGRVPFIIPLPGDVSGFHSSLALKSFMSAGKYEIVLTVSGGRRNNRYLIIAIFNNQGYVIYDTNNINIPTITGRFLSDYRAEVMVEETGERAMIDLSSRREEYNRRFVYNLSGTLRSPVAVRVNGFSLVEFVGADNDSVLNIRKIIDLSGAGRADYIAYVEVILKFTDGRWNVTDTWISPAEGLHRLPLAIILN